MAMQVIYSAGTAASSSMGCPSRFTSRASPRPPRRIIHSSPGMTRREHSPSPRGSRADISGWGPVMPGYQPTQKSTTALKTVEVRHVTDGDTNLKDSIPAMPKALAITCLILNILCPGLGTFVSGVSVFCCSKVRVHGGGKLNVVWVNTWVALLQFLTAFLFLLGWIWSIMWGAAFLSICDEPAEADEDDPSGKLTVKPDDDTTLPEGSAHAGVIGVQRVDSSQVPQNKNPIIVLQEAPLVSQSNGTSMYDSPSVHNPYEPGNQRILHGQNGNFEVPFAFADAESFESLVIHSPDESDSEQNKNGTTSEKIRSISAEGEYKGKYSQNRNGSLQLAASLEDEENKPLTG